MSKIFISYRRDDSAVIAGRIYDYLIPPLGPFAPEMIFRDVDNLPLGVDYKRFLESEVEQCDVCLVIIGPGWLTARDEHGNLRLKNPADFVRIEIEAALKRAIPVIPMLVMNARAPTVDELPPTMADLVYQNGTQIGLDPHFKPDMGRVVRSLQQWVKPASQLAIVAPPDAEPVVPKPVVPLAGGRYKRSMTPEIQPVASIFPLLEWIEVPAGRVTLEENAGTYNVAPFAIAKYPVTNAQFETFIADGGYTVDRYWEGLAERKTRPTAEYWSTPDCPRETVNWFEAMAFARWLSAKTGSIVTLPTEMQWQWAATKDTGWAYPFGAEFDKTKCNTVESGIKHTTLVTAYPGGASPFGVMDMSGNVWEWMRNELENPTDQNVTSMNKRVVRGGSWDNAFARARAAYRFNRSPSYRGNYIGFRVVMDHPASR